MLRGGAQCLGTCGQGEIQLLGRIFDRDSPSCRLTQEVLILCGKTGIVHSISEDKVAI